MQLALTPEEAAFRDELRTFYTTKIPAEIRERNRLGLPLGKEGIVTAHKILHEHGLAVPNWPVEWGGKDWTPNQHQIWLDEMQLAGVPEPLTFNARMVGPVIAEFGSAGGQGALPAADRGARHLVVPGLLRARGRLRPGLAAHHRDAATATATWSTARRPGPRWASTPTGSSAWSAPTRRHPRSRPASRSC